jgi:hypothetical protein
MTAIRASHVAYCGLCCGACPAYTGTIPDLAARLKKELKDSKVEKVVGKVPLPGLEHYREFAATLDNLSKQRCRKACKEGGGFAKCGIRVCCTGRELAGCWECDESASCEKLDFIRLAHGAGLDRRFRKIRKDGLKELVATKPKW